MPISSTKGGTGRSGNGSTARRRDRAVEKYDRLADEYDRRWSFYIQETIRHTLERLLLVPRHRVLDVGCGTGVLLKALARSVPGASLCGVDPAPAMVEVARERLGRSARLVLGTAEELPFAREEFDLVVSTNALHYFPRPLQALSEVSRVLRPGGKAVVTDWCDDYLACKVCNLGLRLFSNAHVRTYGRDDCRRLLEGASFASVQVESYKINWLWGLMTATGERCPQ